MKNLIGIRSKKIIKNQLINLRKYVGKIMWGGGYTYKKKIFFIKRILFFSISKWYGDQIYEGFIYTSCKLKRDMAGVP